MFDQFHQLTRDGKCKLILTIEAKGEELAVHIAPLPTSADANPALSQPLYLIGTPVEMEEGVATILQRFFDSRRTLSQALDDATTVMKAATAVANKQAAAAISHKTDSDGETSSLPAPAIVAPDTKTIDLFGGK